MAALGSAFAGHRLVALDTSVWIYHFEGSPTYGHEVQSERVAKMKAGDASVSLDLLVRSLLAIGTSSKELAKIIAGPQIDKKAA